jgi:SSS family solute:Na+ symporter
VEVDLEMGEPARVLTWLDWSMVLLYLGLVAVVGAWCARRQKSTEEYFVGGRAIPGWAAGLSLFASAISTATFLVYPGHAFGGDWTRLLPGLMLPIVALFLARVVIPFYRQVVRMSAYEFLESRFGYPARAYAALLFVVLNVFRTGFILFLTAGAIYTMTGWDIRWIIVVCGLVTIAYTMVGGIDAVIWTDVLQGIVLLGGGLACAGLLLFSFEGGPGHAIQIALDANKFKLAEWSLDLTRPSVLVMALFGLVAYTGIYTTGQDSVQRYLAVPNLRDAKRGMWLSTWACVFTWTLFMFIGTMLYSYYTIHPDQLPAAIAAKETQVFSYFVMTRLPAGVVGLILAAMLAAAMSSLDTSINSMAMVSMEDFYHRLRPTTSDAHRLHLAKWATLLWGLLGTAAGLSMIRIEKALDFSYVVASILGGGLLGLFLLAFFDRKAHARGIYLGLIAGIAVTTWGTLDQLIALTRTDAVTSRGMIFPLDPLMLVTLANAVSFGVGYLASRVLPNRGQAGTIGPTVWDEAYRSSSARTP